MPEERIPATELGKVMGDYFYVFTQKGPFGYLPDPFKGLAQLTVLYALASQLHESVRLPILASISKSIGQQAEQMTATIQT